MSRGATISYNLKGLSELSDQWEEAIDWIRGNRGDAERVALAAAQVLVGAVREHIMDTSRGRGPRTGRLARSFREEAEVTQRSMHIRAVSDLIYASIQDKGGIIRPKHVKKLAIPLIPMAIGKWPRHWPKGKLFRRGNALSIRHGKGKRARIENVYALADSVKIEPKHYLEKASRQAAPEIAAFIAKKLAQKVVP